MVVNSRPPSTGSTRSQLNINIVERPVYKSPYWRLKLGNKRNSSRRDGQGQRSERGNFHSNSNSSQFRDQRNQQPTYDQREEHPKRPRKRIDLIPRNLTQETYVKALTDSSQYIVFAMGPAGCGKTLLATQYAIKALVDGTFDRIVITRPAVSVDEQHGFLPGSLFQKMEPWILPILDVFKEHFMPYQIEKMIADGIIEISPLAYMRGRTFKNAIVIADEMQNSTISQTKMVLTRIGENSRIVMTGDLNQHDRGFNDNGLKDFVQRFSASESRCENISVVNFAQGDVERHPVIEQILSLYEDEKPAQPGE